MPGTPILVELVGVDKLSPVLKRIGGSMKELQKAAQEVNRRLEDVAPSRAAEAPLLTIENKLKGIARLEDDIKNKMQAAMAAGKTTEVSKYAAQLNELKAKFTEIRGVAAQLAAPIHKGTAETIQMSKSAADAAKNFQLITKAAQGSLGIIDKMRMKMNTLRSSIGGAFNLLSGIGMIFGGITFTGLISQSMEYAKTYDYLIKSYQRVLEEQEDMTKAKAEKMAKAAGDVMMEVVKSVPLEEGEALKLLSSYQRQFLELQGRMPTEKEMREAIPVAAALYRYLEKGSTAAHNLKARLPKMVATLLTGDPSRIKDMMSQTKTMPKGFKEMAEAAMKTTDPMERIAAISDILRKKGADPEVIGTLYETSLALFKSRFQNVLAKFGLTVLPILSKLADLFMKIDDSTGGMLSTIIMVVALMSSLAMTLMPLLIVGSGGLGAALLILIPVIGVILYKSGALEKIWNTLKGIWEKLKGIIGETGATIATALIAVAPILGILAGLGKFGKGPFARFFKKKKVTTLDDFGGRPGRLRRALSSVGRVGKRAFNGIRSGATRAARAISRIPMPTRLGRAGRTVSRVFSRIPGSLGRVGGAIASIGGKFGSLAGRLSGLGSSLMGIFSGLGSILMNPYMILIMIVIVIVIILWKTGALAKIAKALGDAWKAFSSAVMSALKPIADFLKKLWDGAAKLVGQIKKALGLEKKTPEEKKKEGMKKKREAEKRKVEDKAAMKSLERMGVPKPLRDVTAGLLKTPLRPLVLGNIRLFNMLMKVLRPLRKIFKQIGNAIKKHFTKHLRTLRRILAPLFRIFMRWVNVLKAAWATISRMLKPALDFLRSAFQKVWDIVKPIVDAFWKFVDAVKSAADKAWVAFKKIWDAAMKFLQPVLDIIGAIAGFLGFGGGGGGGKGGGGGGKTETGAGSPFYVRHAGVGAFEVEFPDLDPRNLARLRDITANLARARLGGAGIVKPIIHVGGGRGASHNYYIGSGAFQITVRDMTPTEAKRVLVKALESITATRRAFML